MSHAQISTALPYPPSVNSMYRAFRKRVIKSARYTSWIKEAKPIAVGALASDWDGIYAGLGSERVSLYVRAFPPDKRDRDLDNLLKPILDLLEDANWIKNDSQVDKIVIERHPSERNDPRVEVIMLPSKGGQP